MTEEELDPSSIGEPTISFVHMSCTKAEELASSCAGLPIILPVVIPHNSRNRLFYAILPNLNT